MTSVNFPPHQPPNIPPQHSSQTSPQGTPSPFTNVAASSEPLWIYVFDQSDEPSQEQWRTLFVTGNNLQDWLSTTYPLGQQLHADVKHTTFLGHSITAYYRTINSDDFSFEISKLREKIHNYTNMYQEEKDELNDALTQYENGKFSSWDDCVASLKRIDFNNVHPDDPA